MNEGSRGEWLEGVIADEGVDPRIKRAAVELYPIVGTDDVWVGTVAELVERLQECDRHRTVLVVLSGAE